MNDDAPKDPHAPPCEGATILLRQSGWRIVGDKNVFYDTVVWQLPDGQIVTKEAPAPDVPATPLNPG